MLILSKLLSNVKIFKGATYTLIGNLSFSFSQWCILIIINKLGTPNDVGIFTLSLAILNPLFMLAQGGLRSYIVIDTARKFSFDTYFNLRLIFSIIALILSVIFVFNDTYFYSVILLSVYKLFDCLFDIFYGEYQRSDTMKMIAVSRTSRAISNGVLFLLAYLFTKSLNIALLTYIISSIVVFIFYDYRKYKFQFNKKSITFSALKKLTLISFPLAITALLISLNTSIPRLLLEKHSGLVELGAFGSFMYIITVAQIIVQSVCQAFTPKMAQAYYNNNHDVFKNITKTLVIFTILISFLFCTFSFLFKDLLFLLIFNTEFIQYSDLYSKIILIAPFIFLALVFGNINTARRRIKYQPILFFIILIINIPLSYFSILYIGANGAVLSSLIVSILTIILLTIYSIKGREG
ncbi:MATE family efflux transporter [Providencia sp. PROV236]|uniref:MATE family efflux transporter n=1 Tax=Providencia sp. PROV236 TaxID=2936798 RepID=UPI0034E1C9F6